MAIHFLSLGAGVQSSTMALMAACGELTPMPSAAIFADTQAEPQSVYQWLNWLEKQLPFPLIRESKGDLYERSLTVRRSKGGKFYTQSSVPAFICDADGKQGLLMRQCTRDFKLDAIRSVTWRLTRGKPCVMWIGISCDEAHRMKPSRRNYINNIWPLIDAGLSRADCLKWMESRGYPQPPRSACSFCPYHSNEEWIRLRDEEPRAFADAIKYEERLQESMRKVTGFRGTPFLHRALRPLREINFEAEQSTPDQFGNECEGMCGL
jgi:hypothetical protein